MGTFERDGTTIYYEEHGTGFPVLLIAPGGMRSSIEAWERAPWNPVEQLSSSYRVIAMDQRNAGRSTGPISGSDGWATYTTDQLALLDHLGVDRFHVLGMCIGGSYIVNLLHEVPARVASAVALQPIGLDGNRDAFYEMFDGWAAEQKAAHPEADESDWAGFREGMYGGGDMLFSVPASEIAAFVTPILVLMGNDRFHPRSASRKLAATAPNAILVEQWKEPEHQPAARAAVEKFLAENTPG
ncbi:alpha/beta fold hydrolase [Pseudonocardia acidicola]|uniref:Alpha/beta hydrolase n=1 Tax=Pseudonocardia acidicola TaxID=2724939 RepID=A0ABX1SBJ2_9PSEU|nr:alpha/beta hydrolase [Pseudonocardia acidicola]NMH98933.1 alpha/beta hydrolase [Pseudonocardia acidicola]